MKKNCKGCGHTPHSQDELHGKGIRVFNEHMSGSPAKRVLRCTRCGAQEIQAAPEAAKKGEKA